MPTYPHDCQDCEVTWDVVTTVAQRDDPSECPKCKKLGTRRQVVNFSFDSSVGDWNRQQFHPSLGCYVKSDKEARKIAKQRGLEEVGNEKPETIHKHFEKKREEKRAERWAEAERVKQFE